MLSAATPEIKTESLTVWLDNGVKIAITGGVISFSGVSSLLTVTTIGERLIELPPRSVMVTEIT